MRTAITSVVIILLVLLSFIAGMRCQSRNKKVETVVRIDTIIRENVVFDTVYIKEQVPVYLPKYDTITSTILVHDTVLVTVPISQYTKRDSLYFVQVSGFDVRFDKIEIYPKTIIRTEFLKNKSRWGFGLQVGYGVSLSGCNIRASPYVGVGINYNLVSW